MITNIHDTFKTLADSHKMISSFRYNDKFAIEKTGQSLYPQLFLEDDPTIDYDLAIKTFSFTYYLIELPKEDQSDYLQLQEKLESINDAFVVKFVNEYRNIIEKAYTINAIFLKEWNGDQTVALRVEITFDTILDKNNCLDVWE